MHFPKIRISFYYFPQQLQKPHMGTDSIIVKVRQIFSITWVAFRSGSLWVTHISDLTHHSCLETKYQAANKLTNTKWDAIWCNKQNQFSTYMRVFQNKIWNGFSLDSQVPHKFGLALVGNYFAISCFKIDSEILFRTSHSINSTIFIKF